MKTKGLLFRILFTSVILLVCCFAKAQVKNATVTINSDTTYQKITGFGGFVCSPQFGYNFMSADEIKKVWGNGSEAGCNIMRLFIPDGETNWSQSLATAQLAKSLGIIVFASPWTMPPQWKTYNSENSLYTDNSGTHNNYLQEAHYADYANYLNDYVVYLRQNGVELDAISIQNEPDMGVNYQGCIWTPAQLTTFIKNYGSLISCPIIAPESIGMTDDFANALSADDVIDNFSIYAGHQYGAIQSGFQQLQAKGKEAWMTEYLLNWNSDATVPARNFDWQEDAFSFATSLNTALLANVNAWIYYSAKRFYSLIGDGTEGTVNGVMTKRGYILSQYAKNTIGSTRIKTEWKDDSNVLQGSSFISQTGDSVIVMVINSSNDAYSLTVDLPFYTKAGKSILTTSSVDWSDSDLVIDEETYRPAVNISASSMTTLIFTKSSDRPVSQMTGTPVYYNPIEQQMPTNANFGSSWQLSGKTVTFDHSNNLISSNTNANNGYLKLNGNYNRLVFNIKNITSASTYTSGTTTLYYINGAGNFNSYNYGTITFVQNGSSQWALDISNQVLTDGCTGIIGISNSNYTSILTIQFGDVYFAFGNEKGYTFNGDYSEDDSNLLDCLEDNSYTSLDFTEATGVPSDENWQANAANKNCLYYVASDVSNNNANVISGSYCNSLVLTGDDEGNNFYAPVSFTSAAASFNHTFNGYEMLVLPFEATIPDGVKAYTLQYSASDVTCTLISGNIIPANTPVLVNATGTYTFTGSGDVSMPEATQEDSLQSVYIAQNAPIGSYILSTDNNTPSFNRIAAGSSYPTIMPFNAYLVAAVASASQLPIIFTDGTAIPLIVFEKEKDNTLYDLMGHRIIHPQKNVVYIYQDGRKVIFF